MSKKKNKVSEGSFSKADSPWSTELAIRRHIKRVRDYKDIGMLFRRIIFIIIFLSLFFCMLFGVHTVDGEDMKPRLSDGDLALFFRLEPVYEVREVVVYRAGGRNRVGRIIAIPGDEVEVSDGGITINGYLTAEDGIYYSTPNYDERITYPVRLGDDEFFILADFREGARDSRYYGAVSRGEIKGKIITLIRSHGF